MRIVKHGPQSQQTEIEFTLGVLRAEVVKLTKPGASFQVRTQTAVIGVVGTDFFVEATPQVTRVTCTQGSVAVRSINAAVVGQVAMQVGQTTAVASGLPPAAPMPILAGQVQNQMSQTSTKGAPTAQPAAQQSSAAAGKQAGPTTPAGGAAPRRLKPILEASPRGEQPAGEFAPAISVFVSPRLPM